MADKFYVTAAIPYVNGLPHLGHTLEFTIVDVISRYQRLSSKKALLTSGSDENGQKILQAAKKENLPPQKLADKYTKDFLAHAKQLNVNFDVWRRGTDKKNHWPGVVKLWQRAEKNGDIYKKKYQGLYCVGCEKYLGEADLDEQKCCPDHKTRPEEHSEENYFFKLSAFQDGEVQFDRCQWRPQLVADN